MELIQSMIKYDAPMKSYQNAIISIWVASVQHHYKALLQHVYYLDSVQATVFH